MAFYCFLMPSFARLGVGGLGLDALSLTRGAGGGAMTDVGWYLG